MSPVVFERYSKYSKVDVAKAIDLELKGDIESCLIATGERKQKPIYRDLDLMLISLVMVDFLLRPVYVCSEVCWKQAGLLC